MSITQRQLGALARGVALELTWGLPAVAREVRAWRARAQRIPDPSLRVDALSALVRKRGNADGAALFWMLPRSRSLPLLRLLVVVQTLWDFLDSVNERGAAAGQANGRQLHLALIDALDSERPISDYYRHHPWREDGGYLHALIMACREGCAHLPSYSRIRIPLMQEATRAQAQGINHEPDPAVRDAVLREWASAECHEKPDLGRSGTSWPVTGEPGFRGSSIGIPDVSWFELTAAASASLTVHALLTLGAEPSCTELDVERIRDAYFPWVSAAATMLDSYVDQSQDATNGDHIYISHYGAPPLAERRIRQLIQRGLAKARALPNGNRHELVVACMVAMYLSKDSARIPAMRATTDGLINAGGSLIQILLPILRLWRIAYAQCSA